MAMTSKITVIGSFVLQTLVVFAGNSRLFGLLQPGSGWYTNVEMSTRYASLVTPAKWAFAIWGVIYIWEIVAMIYLAVRRVENLAFFQSSAPALWVAANFFQGLWALLFATERLTLSALALAGIAVSLSWLAFTLLDVGGVEYFTVVAPIWLHAGWTCAASIVNLNLAIGQAADVPTQLAAAYASVFTAFAVGVAVVYGASDSMAASPLVATPFVLALCWALAAIRSELHAPSLISSSSTYAEIGEIGRSALQIVVGGCVVAFGLISIVIVISRLFGADTSRRLEMA